MSLLFVPHPLVFNALALHFVLFCCLWRVDVTLRNSFAMIYGTMFTLIQCCALECANPLTHRLGGQINESTAEHSVGTFTKMGEDAEHGSATSDCSGSSLHVLTCCVGKQGRNLCRGGPSLKRDNRASWCCRHRGHRDRTIRRHAFRKAPPAGSPHSRSPLFPVRLLFPLGHLLL